MYTYLMPHTCTLILKECIIKIYLYNHLNILYNTYRTLLYCVCTHACTHICITDRPIKLGSQHIARCWPSWSGRYVPASTKDLGSHTWTPIPTRSHKNPTRIPWSVWEGASRYWWSLEKPLMLGWDGKERYDLCRICRHTGVMQTSGTHGTHGNSV